MKRTVRNGIAIAGMVGGFWLLGQAVASASEQDAGATAATSSSQSTEASGGDATNVNGSENGASAENVAVTSAETDVDGGDGGTNIAAVNTGVLGDAEGSESHEVVKVDTGDVEVNQEANGGDVSDSGNTAVSGAGGDQTATADATTDVDQDATSEDGGHGGDGPKHESQSLNGTGGGHGDDATNVNHSGNVADASNKSITSVETDVDGGDGGLNVALVNTGVIGDLYCHEGGCIYFIKTGDVTVNQQANGGDVSDSGNVAVKGNGGDQVADANASTDVDQNASTENGWWWWDNGDAKNLNWSDNVATAENVRIVRVDTDVNGGDGGKNFALINTGWIGNLYCEKGGCKVFLITGDVTLNQEANGGDVTGSGNVVVGDHGNKGDENKGDDNKNNEQPGKTIVPPAQQAPVKVVTVVTALPTAQPSGQLAFTGADVSAPLALGLLALGLGTGLTALGRRRTATAA